MKKNQAFILSAVWLILAAVSLAARQPAWTGGAIACSTVWQAADWLQGQRR